LCSPGGSTVRGGGLRALVASSKQLFWGQYFLQVTQPTTLKQQKKQTGFLCPMQNSLNV